MSSLRLDMVRLWLQAAVFWKDVRVRRLCGGFWRALQLLTNWEQKQYCIVRQYSSYAHIKIPTASIPQELAQPYQLLHQACSNIVTLTNYVHDMSSLCHASYHLMRKGASRIFLNTALACLNGEKATVLAALLFFSINRTQAVRFKLSKWKINL